ncbi:hypothetical protein J5681_08535 [bacterium]|nr:hypothetical protein [bacterium]
MKKYYEDLKKIEDFTSFDRTQLLDYIHRQKFEASALCAADPEPFALPPTFWVELDYIIGLAKSVSENKKDDFAETVMPLMQEKIAVIQKIMKKLPENEFFYLKKDLKTFEEIFSHASNIIGKKLNYFLPFSLFINAIDSMTVLYPLREKGCDAGTIARNNYDILLARYLAGDFSPQLVEIIDYFIWVQAVFSKAVDKDKLLFREEIVHRLTAFIDKESDFTNASDYSAKSFVLELHEVLTDINIKSRIQELLNKIMGTKISVGECLRIITSIFIDPDISGNANVFRDITIASDLASSVIKHIKEGNNSAMYEDIALSKAMKSYFLQVSRYMLDTRIDMEVCRLFEIMFYLEATAPSFIMHDDIITLLENSIEKFENQKESMAKALNRTFDPESAELFKAKMKQVYAGKI